MKTALRTISVRYIISRCLMVLLVIMIKMNEEKRLMLFSQFQLSSVINVNCRFYKKPVYWNKNVLLMHLS